MATNRQTLLLYTTDIQAATTEINAAIGAITIRLSNSVFVASMPSFYNTNLLRRSSLTPPNLLDEVSIAMLNAWRAVQERDLLKPILKRRISLARRGIAAVAVVMETDISSSTFPLVLAGAHSLAATYAGEVLASNKLTFVLKPYHVDSPAVPEAGPPNVPSQLGVQPAVMVPSIRMSAWPSAALFNNKLFCFYRGHNADSLFYNEYNGSSWSGEQQVPGVVTSEGPSAVVFNNKLYCFKQGNEGDHEIWYASFDGNQWANPLKIPDTRITAGPSVLVFNNKLYCFHQGWTNPSNALWFNVFDGQTWEGDKRVQGASIMASPSAVVFNNLIYCFYQGSGIYEKVPMVSVLTPATGVWSEQRPVPNSKRMSQGPSAVVLDGKLYCFHQDESEGHLYVNVTSDGIKWGNDTLIEDISMCEGLATANFNNELYYFFQKGEGGKVTDGEMWYRKLKLAEGASLTTEEWGISQGEPSLEALGYEAGYKGFIKMATDMYVTTESASYGYVLYITKSRLLYDAYADETRMCLRFVEPSYIHYSFAKMFSAQGTFDQRLLSSNANYPPRPVSSEEPSYTLAWVADWSYVLENATLIIFHRANDTTANPHLWLLFLDKRNSRWVEMEGPKMSFRVELYRGAPAPQFGPGSRLYVFYHAEANTFEMRYNVLGATNEEGEKIWDVEKVMHSIQGSNTPCALSVGQHMHVFHMGASGGVQFRYTTLDTRFNHWAEDQLAFTVRAGTAPSAVHYKGRMYVFNIGLGGKVEVSIWDKDKLTWDQATNMNADSTHLVFGEPTAVVHTDYVYVFYVSNGPRIWWNQFNGVQWRGPTQVNMAYSNVNPRNEGIGAYVWGDKIHCFFRGLNVQDGKMLFYKVFNTVDFTWNEEVILPTASGFSTKPGVILNHLIIGS